MTPANEQECTQVADLAAAAKAMTGQQVAVAFVDQGHAGAEPEQAADDRGTRLEVVKLPVVKRGLYSCPKVGWSSAV